MKRPSRSPLRWSDDFVHLWHDLEDRHGERDWCVVLDENLVRAGADPLRGLRARRRGRLIALRGGERVKSLRTLRRLYDAAIESGLGRDALVIAVGGGTVGDVAGFFAATWARGVDWICVATTTLAMADSSLGGKTAVDHRGLKNPIGAFHDPIEVHGVRSALRSLPSRHARAGLVEVVKSAVIADAALFEEIEGVAARGDRWRCDWEWLDAAARVKHEVVSEDPRERGRREILNFGHTFGHAFEAVCRPRLLHGEAVAVGMVAAAWLSERAAGAPSGTLDRIVGVLRWNGPFRAVSSVTPATICEAISYDKKARRGKPRLVLTPGIGSASVLDRVTPSTLRRAIEVAQRQVAATRGAGVRGPR